MDTPKKDLNQIRSLHEQARRALAQSRWDEAEQAAHGALALDENHAPSYDLMSEIYSSRQMDAEARNWREKAAEIRKQVWQRQVEAEARGHHEVLGVPGRHEIP